MAFIQVIAKQNFTYTHALYGMWLLIHAGIGANPC